jgi:rRNA maturation endonuclease Nob1
MELSRWVCAYEECARVFTHKPDVCPTCGSNKFLLSRYDWGKYDKKIWGRKEKEETK